MTENENDRERLIYSLKIPGTKKATRFSGWSLRKKTLIAACVLLIGAGFILFQQWMRPPKVVVVRSEIVQEGLPETTLTAGGYLVADSTILVSSQINGKIKSVLVKEGDKVQKDQILAEIEDDDYRAKFQIEKSQYDLAAAQFARKKVLFREGVIARAEYDEVEKTLEVRKASLESARYFLENTKVRSPIEGTVISKEKEPGEFLLPGITSEGIPGSAVLKVADLRVMNVEMDILESDLEKIKLDQPALIMPDALPHRSYKANLFYISPQANRQQSIVQMKVRLEAPDELLKPEMSARVYFLKNETQQEVHRRVALPASAVLSRKQERVVFVVKKDELIEKKVEIASENEGKFLISSGLEGDEPVVLYPKPGFKNGMKVRVEVEKEE